VLWRTSFAACRASGSTGSDPLDAPRSQEIAAVWYRGPGWIRPGSEPLVSVIIPVFNGERYLAEALESVFAQDHRPVEVIVIDDGSTDASAEVARSFDEVVLVVTENAGAAAARNLGLARATGTFLAFLDADDLMAPGRLTAQLGYLSAHPKTGCVLMNQELLLEPGVTHPLWGPRRDHRDGPGGVPPMTALIRRATYELLGGFDSSYRVCHDTDWLFRLQDAGVRIDVFPEVGVIRRIHGGNLTHQIDVIRLELARIVRRRIERARARGSEPVP
jgi:glycosyltransferase involved in cell wall biosynthesis